MDDRSVEDLVEAISQGGDKGTEALAELALRAEMAERKHLTNMFDYRGFLREIDKEKSLVSRGQSMGGIVIFGDAAGFKGLNDRQGERQGGDRGLELIADEIRKIGFRNTDILANPGGDDFTIIMTNTRLVMPQYKLLRTSPSADFQTSSDPAHKPWLKIQRLNKRLRLLGFNGQNKYGKDFTDTVSMRFTVSEYGNPEKGERSLNQALAHCEAQTKDIKKLTQHYIKGGR